MVAAVGDVQIIALRRQPHRKPQRQQGFAAAPEFDRLDQARDVGGIVERLRETFPDVPTEQLEADAAGFLDELAAAGLVVDDAAD